jgi:hypothetical protein
MDRPLTEVNVSWTRFDIVSDEFMWHGQLTGRGCWLKPTVQDWVDEYRDQGYNIELKEWWVPWISAGGIVDRIEGVTFMFEEPSIAVMFKLAWGGK